MRLTSNYGPEPEKAATEGLDAGALAFPHQERNTDPHNHVRRGAILKLGESAHAKALGELLAGASTELRKAIFALALDPAVQVGVIRAGLEFWPENMPRGKVGAEREVCLG